MTGSPVPEDSRGVPPRAITVVSVTPSAGSAIAGHEPTIAATVRYEIGPEKLAWLVVSYEYQADPDKPDSNWTTTAFEKQVTTSGTQTITFPLEHLSSDLTSTVLSFEIDQMTLTDFLGPTYDGAHAATVKYTIAR